MHVHLLLSLSARRGQPVVLDMMTKQFGKDFDERFGHKTGRTLLSATAGSLIGVGEIILLPLDALKVKAQTAPEQLRGRGVVDIFAKEGFNLYRGAGFTAMVRKHCHFKCLFNVIYY